MPEAENRGDDSFEAVMRAKSPPGNSLAFTGKDTRHQSLEARIVAERL